jgi:hypothetical protein
MHFWHLESIKRPLSAKERRIFAIASVLEALIVAAVFVTSLVYYVQQRQVVYSIGPYQNGETSSLLGPIGFQLGCISNSTCCGDAYLELNKRYRTWYKFSIIASTDVVNDAQCEDLDVFAFNSSTTASTMNKFYLEQWVQIDFSYTAFAWPNVTVQYRRSSARTTSTSGQLHVAEAAHDNCDFGILDWAGAKCSAAGRPAALGSGYPAVGQRSTLNGADKAYDDLTLNLKCDPFEPLNLTVSPVPPTPPEDQAVWWNVRACKTQIENYFVFSSSTTGNKTWYYPITGLLPFPSELCRQFFDSARDPEFKGVKFLNREERRNSIFQCLSLSIPIASIVWTILTVVVPFLLRSLPCLLRDQLRNLRYQVKQDTGLDSSRGTGALMWSGGEEAGGEGLVDVDGGDRGGRSDVLLDAHA